MDLSVFARTLMPGDEIPSSFVTNIVGMDLF
jgi:hypothetical protein